MNKEMIKSEEFWISAITVLNIFSPIITYVFIFHRNFFLEVDFIKIIFLSTAIFIPFVLLSFLFLVFVYSNEKKKVLDTFTMSVLSILFASIPFYIILIFNIIFPYHFSDIENTFLCLVVFFVATSLLILTQKKGSSS